VKFKVLERSLLILGRGGRGGRKGDIYPKEERNLASPRQKKKKKTCNCSAREEKGKGNVAVYALLRGKRGEKKEISGEMHSRAIDAKGGGENHSSNKKKTEELVHKYILI